jgi:hypothetical protein
VEHREEVMSKSSGKRRFRKTKFGKRALVGARSGTDHIENPDGSKSSVLTATFDIPGKKGRTDVMVAPTIRKIGGAARRLAALRWRLATSFV